MKISLYDEILAYLASASAAMGLLAFASALFGDPSDILNISAVALLIATGLFGLFAEQK